MTNEHDRVAVFDRRHAEILLLRHFFRLFLLDESSTCPSVDVLGLALHLGHFHFERHGNAAGVLLRNTRDFGT